MGGETSRPAQMCFTGKGHLVAFGVQCRAALLLQWMGTDSLGDDTVLQAPRARMCEVARRTNLALRVYNYA